MPESLPTVHMDQAQAFNLTLWGPIIYIPHTCYFKGSLTLTGPVGGGFFKKLSVNVEAAELSVKINVHV